MTQVHRGNLGGVLLSTGAQFVEKRQVKLVVAGWFTITCVWTESEI